MVEMSKGKSPFYPGQPVPVELFVGRREQIDRILTRGVQQVAQGKPVAIFVQGEYGIGKSSIASVIQRIAEERDGLYGIYASLGGCRDLADVAVAVMEGTVRSGALDPTRTEKIRHWLGTYVRTEGLFGIGVNLEALRRDAPSVSTPMGMLTFLGEVWKRLADTKVKGVFLVLDEINGISSNPGFANLVKGIVDSNATSKEQVPLLLMLCGVEERRREMIQTHQPVERVFDVVEIGPMTEPEMREFFARAFESVQMSVEESAMSILTHYAAGLPKIMHLIGDAAYWIDQDGVIDRTEAIQAVLAAAEDVGRKYVEQQVYRALRSDAYRSILRKIGEMGLGATFRKSEVAKGLTEEERKKLNNFLQRMSRKLHVIRPGEVPGEYVFNMRMTQVYIWLNSLRTEEGRPA